MSIKMQKSVLKLFVLQKSNASLAFACVFSKFMAGRFFFSVELQQIKDTKNKNMKG